MSRYIDADALKEIIMDMRNHAEPSPCLPHQTLLIPDGLVCNKIDAMPTVDAVQVVRCKDCKFSSQDWENAVWCRNEGIGRYNDWFCADGKRKDGAE